MYGLAREPRLRKRHNQCKELKNLSRRKAIHFGLEFNELLKGRRLLHLNNTFQNGEIKARRMLGLFAQQTTRVLIFHLFDF